MRKKILIVLLIAVAIFGIKLKNKKGYMPPGQRRTAQEAKKKTGDAKTLLAQAENYLQKEELLKAKEYYEETIKTSSKRSIIKKAKKGLAEVNAQLLFSPFNAENSEIYKVQQGDNLFLIAKKFGTTVDLIKKSNNLERSTIYPNQSLKIPLVKFSILVDKSDNTLVLKAGNKVLKEYSVSTGKVNSTPVGEFKIISKLINPVWYSPGKVIPSGSPDNVLGSRWLGISIESYGIHGTIEPETIGRQITHGCVRMLNKDVEEVYSIVPVGTKVVIKD